MILYYCEHCGKPVYTKYGSGRFCSKSCANARVHSTETKEKIGKTITDKAIKYYCKSCGKRIRKCNKTGYCVDCMPRCQEESTKKKLSKIALKRELGGFNFRNKGIYYNGIKLDSSYEVEVAKSLDDNNIKWLREGRFPYIDRNGKERHYIPDFYLPDYDVYLDPKNDFLIENINPVLGYSDKEKIQLAQEQNNIRVVILNKDQLTWDVIKTLI